jgi:hypothetical protein
MFPFLHTKHHFGLILIVFGCMREHINYTSKADTKHQPSIVDSIKIRVHAVLEDVTVELQNAKRSIGVLEVSLS